MLLTLVDEPLFCLAKAVERRFCLKKISYIATAATQSRSWLVVMPILPSRIDSKASATLLPQAHFRYIQGCVEGTDKLGMDNGCNMYW